LCHYSLLFYSIPGAGVLGAGVNGLTGDGVGLGVVGAGVGGGVGLADKQAIHVAYQFVPSVVVVPADGSVTS